MRLNITQIVFLFAFGNMKIWKNGICTDILQQNEIVSSKREKQMKINWAKNFVGGMWEWNYNLEKKILKREEKNCDTNV